MKFGARRVHSSAASSASSSPWARAPAAAAVRAEKLWDAVRQAPEAARYLGEWPATAGSSAAPVCRVASLAQLLVRSLAQSLAQSLVRSLGRSLGPSARLRTGQAAVRPVAARLVDSACLAVACRAVPVCPVVVGPADRARLASASCRASASLASARPSTLGDAAGKEQKAWNTADGVVD